jgi:hypothetical protein
MARQSVQQSNSMRTASFSLPAGMTRKTYQCLTLLDILFPEQKLAIEVGQVDGIQIQKGDVPETGEDDVFDCEKTRR